MATAKATSAAGGLFLKNFLLQILYREPEPRYSELSLDERRLNAPDGKRPHPPHAAN
jgi:hypothetical protein